MHSGKARPALAVAETDARTLVHELQVHQIELEMQNEELRRVQAAFEEASSRYSDLFDFAPIAYFLWDRQGRILEVNLAGAALLGLNREDLMHKRFGQFVAMKDRVEFAAFCKHVLAIDAKQICEVTILKDEQVVDTRIEGIATQCREGEERLCRAAIINISQPMRADELTAANHSVQEIRTPETAITRAAVVFNPEEALARCFNSQDMLREMIQCYFDEIEILFPQMRAALEKGDLVEVGRLGHRLKGTIVYLGAEPAKQAALGVECFERVVGQQNEAEEAIRMLEQECKRLADAVTEYRSTMSPAQNK